MSMVPDDLASRVLSSLQRPGLGLELLWEHNAEAMQNLIDRMYGRKTDGTFSAGNPGRPHSFPRWRSIVDKAKRNFCFISLTYRLHLERSAV